MNAESNNQLSFTTSASQSHRFQQRDSTSSKLLKSSAQEIVQQNLEYYVIIQSETIFLT